MAFERGLEEKAGFYIGEGQSWETRKLVGVRSGIMSYIMGPGT